MTVISSQPARRSARLLLVASAAAALISSASMSSAASVSKLVCLRDVAPTIAQDIRYAGSNNFTGATVPGYEAGECWLSRPAAEALARVQKTMEREGRTLLVYDCYRPVRAVKSFVGWAAKQGNRLDPAYFPRVEGSKLIASGYIAARSGHSTGRTVDLTFRQANADAPADTGGLFDLFDPLSHTNAKVAPAQRANRNLLVAAMAKEGFVNYAAEWWHFSLPGAAPALDEPVRACRTR